MKKLKPKILKKPDGTLYKGIKAGMQFKGSLSWMSTEDEIIEAWQSLVDSGAVWSLQGWYGRTAMDLLNDGVLKFPENETFDYYGNRIPTRKDVN